MEILTGRGLFHSHAQTTVNIEERPGIKGLGIFYVWYETKGLYINSPHVCARKWKNADDAVKNSYRAETQREKVKVEELKSQLRFPAWGDLSISHFYVLVKQKN